jgi:hypothetical protein
MPKTSMNKNDNLMFRQNDVGFARKIAAVQPKSIAQSVQHSPDRKLWLCVA